MLKCRYKLRLHKWNILSGSTDLNSLSDVLRLYDISKSVLRSWYTFPKGEGQLRTWSKERNEDRKLERVKENIKVLAERGEQDKKFSCF